MEKFTGHSDGYADNPGFRVTGGVTGGRRLWKSGRGRHNAAKTHCPRGHALVWGNLVPSAAKQGRRTCLTCSRAVSLRVSGERRGVETTWTEAIADVARRWPEMAEAAGIA